MGGSGGHSGWSAAGIGRATESSFSSSASTSGARGELARQIPRRRRVSWWSGLLLALGFAIVVTPAVTADRWLAGLGAGAVKAGAPAPATVRVPPFAGAEARGVELAGGGVVIARGDVATPADEAAARIAAAARPGGAAPYVAFFALAFVFAALFTHHVRRSTRGRLLRVQLVSLAAVAALAIAVKVLMLATAASILVVPIALLALVPTMALDRVVGLGTGILAALIACLLVPFDVTVAVLLLVQAAAAGLLIAEGPKQRWRAVLVAGLATTLLTAATLLLITYLSRGAWPPLGEPLRSPWALAALGPAIAMLLAAPLLPLYQLAVGEITHGKLVELEDLSHPLLRQIAEKAPGTWQHSLMMANLAEIAANEIGANGRLVRVGAYFHDLGKSLSPKHFIENLQPGETSPHDQMPPEMSCDAIFAHVTEGIVVARRAGLHERIVDFMHMHHGDGVLEYFWGKAQEGGNPRGLTIERFRYPGCPPQSRETAILAICDAVEAASRTLKRPEPAAIAALVQRIVYGKLHLGQLDESGLSMADLRRIADSLRETIRHANHGRIEYPWQKAQQDASASLPGDPGTHPRLDSLDRTPHRETAERAAARPPAQIVDEGEATTGSGVRAARRSEDEDLGIVETAPVTPLTREGLLETGAGTAAAAVAAQAAAAAASASLPAYDPSAAEPGAETVQAGPATMAAGPPIRAPMPAASAPLLVAFPSSAPPPAASSAPPPAASPAPPSVASPAPPPAASGRSPAPVLFELPAQKPLGDNTQVGLAPAPDARAAAPDRGLRPSEPKPATAPAPQTGPRPQGTELGFAGPGAAARAHPSDPAFVQARVVARQPPQPPPGARPAPSSGDDLVTPVMPAMLGELVRAESRAESSRTAARADVPDPFDDELAPPPPPASLSRATLPGYTPRPSARGAAPPQPGDSGDVIASAPPPARGAPAVERARAERRGANKVEDPGSTEPAMPRFELPSVPPGATLPASPADPAAPSSAEGGPGWPSGLAARIDAALHDEWSNETPVVAPTKAELRALLGAPDPTRQQSIDEIERLHHAARELHSEVDPDQIEAAIELAPPARRGPNTIAATRPKKPE